jgi:hypothetical protein
MGQTHLEHIQNWRPRLTPGFLVVRFMQGSAWLSQRGGGRREKSFVQPSFEASWRASGSYTAESGGWLVLVEKVVVGDVGRLVWLPVGRVADDGFEKSAASTSVLAVDGGAVSGCGFRSAGLERD